MEKIKLNLGCAGRLLEEYINIDQNSILIKFSQIEIFEFQWKGDRNFTTQVNIIK